MSRERFVNQLETAADNIANVPLHELQILLRRAAIRLRNMPPPGEGADLDAEYERLIDDLNKAENNER